MDSQALTAASHLLRASRNPLISIPESPSTDALATAVALALAFEQRQLHPKIYSPDFQSPAHQKFLVKPQTVTPSLKNLRDFIVSVNTQRVPIESLRYESDGANLRIFLSPKNGHLEPSDISTTPGPFAHDLIILLETPTPDTFHRGQPELFEFFQTTPRLNIDHHPDNQRHSHVNLIEVTASSVAEIAYALLHVHDQNLIQETVATPLLAGMMSKTKLFQSPKVTTQTLTTASALVSAGARRTDVVRHLHQTRSVATLRLWGRALSRVQTNPDKSVVWTEITAEDLRQTGLKADQAIGLVEDLLLSTPGATHYVVFTEQAGDVYIEVAHPDDSRPSGLPSQVQPRATNVVAGTLPGKLADVKTTILEKLATSADA